MSVLLLFVAWLLTGVNLVVNKALIELGFGRWMDIYMIGFWGVGVAAGLTVRAVSRHRSDRLDAIIGVSMGIAGALGMITFLMALERLPGVVVFPVRSCGNVLLTACLSWLIWRERLNPAQWLGILISAIAIYLLV